MNNELNDKQRMFCQEYIIDFNGTQAAIRAGYSKKTANEQASQLLAKLNIQAEVKRLLEKRMQKTELSQEYVVDGLKEVADRCLQKKPVTFYDRETKQREQLTNEAGEGVWTFDSNGANRSLELLGKHLGIFNEKLKIDIDFPTSFAELIKAVIQQDNKPDGNDNTSTPAEETTKDNES